MSSVKLYTNSVCKHSKKLKRILEQHHIKYKEFDVQKEEARHYVVEDDGHIPTPQVDFGGHIIYGKSEKAIAHDLERMMKHR